jgi:two-component system, sensor histidine kinase and response regulator
MTMTTILVIEDETLLRNEVIEWFTMEGYGAIGAADGVEGVTLAIQHEPDVILCDIAMPRLDGYDVMLNIRANTRTKLTPFIYMTARSTVDDVRQGMILGADDYITKPFTRSHLLQTVQARLEKKLLQEQHRQLEIEQWQRAFAEEHEQRLVKAKMVAMFSHDFRNPLTSILSSSEILRNYNDRLDDAHRRVHFNRVEASVYQLLQMLDDMLAVAQLETGNLDFNPEQMNVSEFLRQIIEEFQLIHAETHSLNFKNHLSDVIRADPRLLRQIATNLISNAIKYSPVGSNVSLFLRSSNEHMELVVQDQGIGISEADQPRLFHAFQRASNVGGISGTGLGLTIVKQAVELHGGTVHLESQLGRGTTITVHLPRTSE